MIATGKMLAEKVTALSEAKKNRQPITAFSASEPNFSFKEGYEVQQTMLENDLAAGEELAGFKMGLTSKAKQKDVGVDSAIHGYLLKSFEVEKGGTVLVSTRIHPRVEPEVAVVLKKSLGEMVPTLREVKEAIADILPALEILDSRYEAFNFRLPDVIADNTSASGFLLGRTDLTPYLEDLSLLGVTLKKNGEILETGCPAAVFGDPLLSVLALAKEFHQSGRKLLPGQVILTGGITTSVTFAAGDVIEIVWPQETISFHAKG